MQILKLARIHRVSRLSYYFRLIINCYEGMSYDWLILDRGIQICLDYQIHELYYARYHTSKNWKRRNYTGKHTFDLFFARRVNIFYPSFTHTNVCISNTCGVCSDGIILITEHPEINTKTNINKIQVIKPVNVLININAMNFYNCASQRERSLMGISIH